MAEIGSVSMPEVDIEPLTPLFICLRFNWASQGCCRTITTSLLRSWHGKLSMGLNRAPGNVVAPKKVRGWCPPHCSEFRCFTCWGSAVSWRVSEVNASWLRCISGMRRSQPSSLNENASSHLRAHLRSAVTSFSRKSEGRDLSSLLSVGGGGAARPEQVGQIDDTFEKALPNTGWGMTETGDRHHHFGAEYSERRLSSGPALCVIDLRVVDDDGTNCLRAAAVQVGEPSMFREYW